MHDFSSSAASQRHDYDEHYTAEHAEPHPPRAKAARRPKVNVRQNVAIGNIDITIYLVVTILVIIGVIMVFSANYMQAATDVRFRFDPFHLLRRNALFALFGFIAMNLIAIFGYEYLRIAAWPAYITSIALLLFVIVGGVAVGGATRWMQLPFIGAFQPSELAKVSLIILIAYLVERYPTALRTWPGLMIFGGLVGGAAALVAIPGGFSSSLIIASIGFGMVFIASAYTLRYIVAGLIGAGGVAAFLWWDLTFGGGFRGRRFWIWLDPWSDPTGVGWQPTNALYSIASGGWFGLGIGQSRQATFLPEAHNDMIFAIIVEELGLIGGGMILLLFGIFIWRGIMVALKAPDTFSSLLATGIVFAIAFQAVINVAVVTNSIPNTGVTLPFISYGGTSLMVSMAMAGILLGISRYTKERERGS